ncbi:hypothetical protein ACQEVF_58270 [Nonomuraea polychroma]|uniref:hypothetical protein n=1 Tax=Nonomuraea polychroma TaxID=46176 RepID=UPI003D93DC0F
MNTTTTPAVTTASASDSASTPAMPVSAQIPELAVEVIDGLPVEAVRLLIGSHLIGLAEIGEMCGHAGSGTVSGWVKREPVLAACRVASFKAGPVFWAPAVRAYLESKGRIPQQSSGQDEPAAADSPAAESSAEGEVTESAIDPVEEPSEGDIGPAESPAEIAAPQEVTESEPEPGAQPEVAAEVPAAKRSRRQRKA